MITNHTVQITADNTDVFNSTKAEEVPSWAKTLRLQVIGSDSDWTYSFDMGGTELARDSGCHSTEADNLQTIDWRKAHIQLSLNDLRRERNLVPLLNVNVVTGGVGIACLQYEG